MRQFINNDQSTAQANVNISGVAKYATNDYGASWATAATIAADLAAIYPEPTNGDLAVLRNTNGTDESRFYFYAAGAWENLATATISDGAITNAKVNASAAIAYSKLNLSASIVNADIANAAAIAWSKMASSTDISSTGTVTDLTITGETNGDVLYFDGSNWTAVAATSLPTGVASSLAASTTIDGGANDLTLVTTTQTVGAANLTIPDFANVNQTMALIGLQQTLTNKILSDDSVYFGDSGGLTKKLEFELSGATAAKTMTVASSHTDDRTLTLPDATDTLVGKATTDVFTNKTLDDATVKFGDTGDPTKDLFFSLGGATADKTMTIISSQTDDRSLTLPDATDTLVGKATTDVFTNKSFDCDGTGNVLTNVNANELDPITGNNYGIPFIIPYTLSNQAAAVNIFNANAPFKFRVIKAWSIATSADGGTWKLNNGAGGAGTDITNAVTVAASDQDYDEPSDYDDAAWEIAANGSLSIVPDGAGLLDCQIYIECMRWA